MADWKEKYGIAPTKAAPPKAEFLIAPKTDWKEKYGIAPSTVSTPTIPASVIPEKKPSISIWEKLGLGKVLPKPKAPEPMVSYLPSKPEIPKPIDEKSIMQESKLKDVLDAAYKTTAELFQRGKDYFLSALPNLVFKEIKEVKVPIGITGFEPKIKVSPESSVNKFNAQIRDIFKEKYNKSNIKFEKWLEKNPQLEEREEWKGGVIESIKRNPKVLTDPYYWGYLAAQTIPFTVGIMGTTIATFAITKNPTLAMSAGLAVATPIVSQDLYEDLIKSGATEQQASELTGIMGPAIAGVEVISDFPIMKMLGIDIFWKSLRREATKQIAKLTAKQIIAKGIKTFASIEIIETLEELVQEGLQNATVRTVDKNRSLFQNIPEVAIHSLIGISPLALFGGGKAMIRPRVGIKPSPVEMLPPKVAPSVAEVSPTIAPIAPEAPTRAITPEKGIIPQELQPLAQEAKYVYHGTSEGAARAIQREGELKIGQAIGSDITGYGKQLFFADTEQHAQSYAVRKSTSNYLLRVKKTGEFISDTNVVSKGDFKIGKNIPISDIEIKMPNGKWTSISNYDFYEKEAITQAVKGVKEVKPEVSIGKIAGVAKSIEAKAIEQGLTKKGFDKLAEYSPAVIKEQSQMMSDIMSKNIERAKRIAIGKEALPEGIKGATALSAMEDYAMETKDGQLALDLANSPIAAEISVAGQTLRLTAERTPDSATAKIREIVKEREKVVGKKLKGKTADKAKSEIKDSLKEKIKKEELKISKYDWEFFINSIIC